ncbi:tetratricopeptide repeat protein [Anabaena sp. PCC 7108]|uniref:tetratricopeptide repeat protein n=1 Tax=Anabaena sp. PCC 7108 TaxID=163908 RepID=UPI00034DBD8A|nr:tetratricopeptide repeat protein [Anabaena sp. PCC 7108]
MTKQRFETALQQLKPRRREVLELFLAGNTDQAIAKSLVIAETTVRQHIRKICQDFGLKNGFDDDRTSQRANLMALFAQYKPDLLHKPTVTESQNQASDSILPSHTSTSNKQEACSTEYDPNFVGRNDDIAHLNNLINKGAKIIQIIAPGGTGKTILASKYLQSKFKTVLEFPIGKEIKDIASIENLLEFNLRKLGEEPGKELMASLQQLKQKLQTQEIGILIDNLEPALDASGKFIEQHRSYVELLRILTDSSIKSITLITSRERLCEGLDIILYKLPSLNLEAWSEYWHHQEINPDTPILTEIHKVYGGNALAMKVLCNPIINDFNGDIIAYWQENKTDENLEVETAVANLIKEQFERLAHINLDAYNLLCRMGCYRYQDEYVSTVPEKGVFCLIWDVVKNQHKRIIKILKERALVEFNNDEYSLHPVIRKEAIERLRNNEDWEKANTEAAEFWTESVEIIENAKDALTAFEASFHYLQINNIEKLSYTLCQERGSNFGNFETLSRAFYRIGLLNKMNQMIQLILKIDNIDEKKYVSELYNAAGSFYWLSGDIHEAIKYFDQGKKTAIRHNYNIFTIISLLNLGLCYLDLFLIDKSIEIFADYMNKIESVYKFEEDRQKQEMIWVGYFCLALLNSLKNDLKSSSYFVDKAYKEINAVYRMTPWTRGYSYIYLSLAYKTLGEVQKSFNLCNQAIIYSKNSNYPQVKAKALTGLAELYRIQNEIETALIYHQESIEILEKIGAKCDLAEAYFQLALTYQKIGNKAKIEEHFNKAIYLWSPEQIDASEQIKRVLKAMNS